MAFSWDTFNSNRSGRGGWSDWGLDTSTSYPGSFDFGGVDVFFDPVGFLDAGGLFDDPDWFVQELLADQNVGSGFRLNPAAESILFEDLPYISGAEDYGSLFDNIYDLSEDEARRYRDLRDATLFTPDELFPGQLGGFNPDVGPIGFNFEQSPGTWLDYYGFGAGDLLPGYFTDTEPFGGAHTTVGDESLVISVPPGQQTLNRDNPYVQTYVPGSGFTAEEEEVLGPSGRPQVNTTPGGGSTANTDTGGPSLPGTPGGPSVRDPSDNVPGDGSDDSRGGPRGGGGGGGVGIGGLAASALGLALLREFLKKFDDRDDSTYEGIDMPTVRDIRAPQTPQITPTRVVPYEVYSPMSQPNIQRAEGGLASALRPHMLAVGGRADYREGAPVVGKGTGQSDDIPALLSDGEYVIDADTVAALGDGSNKAGAKVLDEFREMIRKHKRSAPADKIPPKAKSPLAYLKGVKKNG